MTSLKQYRKVLEDLIRLTYRGELHWEEKDPRELPAEPTPPLGSAKTVYFTSYNDRNLFLIQGQETRLPNTGSTPGVFRRKSSAVRAAIRQSQGRQAGNSRMLVENPETETTQPFPPIRMLDDLVRSVRKQVGEPPSESYPRAGRQTGQVHSRPKVADSTKDVDRWVKSVSENA